MQSVASSSNTQAAARPPPRARLPLAIGSVVADRYELCAVLGRGGMGVVYRAWQRDLERPVALKLLPRAATGRHGERQRELERRFEREARCAARVTHPHAVHIFEVGRDRQACFLAMELIEGESLFRVLRGGGLDVTSAVEVARQVGSAVAAAHDQGTLHRDVKPGNIMLLGPRPGADDARPFAKLLDFGLAKQFGAADDEATAAGRKLGSPGYMAPEQALGGPADARSDVYGLAAVLFEMLAGRPPFVGDSAEALMRAHLEQPVPSLPAAWAAAPPRVDVAALSPTTRSGLDGLLQVALAKDPAQRFATMAAFVAALGQGGVLAPAAACEATRLFSSPFEPSPARALPAPRAPHASRRGTTPGPMMTWPLERRQAPASPRAASSPVPGWLLGLVGAAIGVAGSQALKHVPAWHIDTLPRDVAVFWNDRQVCERTPCRVTWQAEEVGGQGMLRFVREGFDDVVQSRRVGRWNQNMTVTLDPSEPAY